MKKEKSEHKNYIDMEVYLADIKRYRETAETQKMLLDKIVKENKKLKSDYDRLDKVASENVRTLDELEAERIELEKENRELKEKVETLELWLDNKEKLNEEYRKQIDKYKRQYEHSMGEDDELIYEEGLYD